MTAFVLCILALTTSWLAARRSLVNGLVVVLAWGYFYGILRANVLASASHFIFDAALLGLYAGQLVDCFSNVDARRTARLRMWIVLLILWPIVVCFVPFQPLLVSIVGFRAAVFFLPVALLGARLHGKELMRLSYWLAALNLAALSFATAEYFLGIERFYPISPVTMLIYVANDVANFTAYRLPATFVTAHAFAGTIVLTLPFLFGAWNLERRRLWRLFLLLGMAAAILGMLMAATRINFVLTLALVSVASIDRLRGRGKWVWMLMIACLAFAAFRNERFQRFKSLSDTDMVSERIAGSVNRSFLEILSDYPMGNGLGGGGTSMPNFLESQVRNPVGLESEYSRILLEEGVIGLALWIGFICWFLIRFRGAFAKGPWLAGRRLAWVACVGSFGIGMLGIGTWTAVPQSMLLALSIGWAAVPSADGAPERKQIFRVQRARVQPVQRVYAR